MLTVSREDVEVDKITEFSLEERFIKLPIQNYLSLLGISETMNKPQIALINAINNPKYRFVCAAFARRLGKTYIANVIAQLVALVPNCNVLIISPNYNLSSISFELQRSFIKHFDLEVERDNLKDRVIELTNGSTVRMGSLSTVDAVVGRSYDIILFDEAALGADAESAFNVQLRPTLDKPNSKAIFISTPRGLNNWFSKFYQRGSNIEFPEWCSMNADWTENFRMSASDVEEAKKSMSNAEFEQEYMASFVTFEGQIFSFDRDKCVMSLPENVDVEVIAGCDPGYKDPTAFVVIAYYEEDGVDYFHIIDERVQSGTTDVHAAAFQRFIDKYEIDLIFIDSAAAQFGADLTYTYDIATSKSKKSMLPGIAYVQSLVEQDRLRIEPHCGEALAAMDQYRWDQREGLIREKPVHDDYSHMADAIRYAVYTFTV